MDNVELVKQAYRNFGEGKVDQVVSLFDPEITWHECKSFPYATGDGTITSPDAVVQEILAAIPEYYDNFAIEPSDFVAGGDKVVMVGYYTGTWKETGKPFKANATHVWTVKKGKLSDFFQAVDTAEIMNP